MELNALLPIAVRAAAVGAELIRSREPGVLTAKGDRDMASEVDFAVERVVRDLLAERTPHIGFLGEEEGARQPATELTWVLDPVDGTANFVHAIPLCGLSLGLVRGDESVLGVIELPFLGTVYTGVLGGGAHVNGRRMSVSPAPDTGPGPGAGPSGGRLADAIVAVGDFAVGAAGVDPAAALNPARHELVRLLAQRVQRVRMLGSAAVDLAWVADGRLGASLSLSNKPWDTAAGVLLAREAGAVVVDLDGTRHTLRSRATVAAAPALLPELLDFLTTALSTTGPQAETRE